MYIFRSIRSRFYCYTEVKFVDEYLYLYKIKTTKTKILIVNTVFIVENLLCM